MNDPLALSRIETMTRGMIARGMDQWSARQAALRLLDRQLFGQASVIAYSRIYMLAAGLILLLIPLLLLVRQTKRAGGEQVVVE
jgi:DHA2 family multidrug resistance protein